MVSQQCQRQLLWGIPFLTPFKAAIGTLVNINPFVQWLTIHGDLDAIDSTGATVHFHCRVLSDRASAHEP